MNQNSSLDTSLQSQMPFANGMNNSQKDFLKDWQSQNWEAIKCYTFEDCLHSSQKCSSLLHQKEFSCFLDSLTSYFVPLEAKAKIAWILRKMCVQEFNKASLAPHLGEIFAGWFQTTKELLKGIPLVYAECYLIEEILKDNPQSSHHDMPYADNPQTKLVERIVKKMIESSWTLSQESSQQFPVFIRRLFEKQAFLTAFTKAQEELKETLHTKLEKAKRKYKEAEREQKEGFTKLGTQAIPSDLIGQCVKFQYESHKVSYLSELLKLDGSTLYTNSASVSVQPSSSSNPNLDEMLDYLGMIIEQNMKDFQRLLGKRQVERENSTTTRLTSIVPLEPPPKKAKPNEASQINNLKAQQDRLLQAIHLDANNSLAYSKLAVTLLGKTVTLFNGTEMTEEALYLKAIQINPNNSHAYSNLAVTLPLGGSATLLNGTKMTQQDLLLKAIQLNPDDGRAYRNLAIILPLKGKATLLDGTEMTQQALYLKAIDLDPNDSFVYSYLARTLSFKGSVILLNGTKMTQQDLLLQAIQLDENNSQAYHDLASILSKGESVTLLNGVNMTKNSLAARVKKIQRDQKST